MSIQNAVCKAATEENKIYIEDYVATYLKQLQREADGIPTRVALFGHTFKKEDRNYFFIYGAACITRNYHYGKSEDTIRQEFFKEHEMIGYVNLYHKTPTGTEKSKYNLFYETNEAMQNYLIYVHKQQLKQEAQKRIPMHESNKESVVGVIKNFLLGSMVLFLACAVNLMNDYALLIEFMQTTEYLWKITA